jgi:predicted secreted protein
LSWTTLAAIYFILWWVVLFAVLPFGVRSQDESGDIQPGTDPGAPVAHQLGKKALWTTAITSVIFAAFYYAFVNKLISLEALAALLGMRR